MTNEEQRLAWAKESYIDHRTLTEWLNEPTDCWATKCSMATNERLEKASNWFVEEHDAHTFKKDYHEPFQAILHEIARRIRLKVWDR